MKIEIEISKELINSICQLFMEHECIEKYDPNTINWVYEKMKENDLRISYKLD